MSVSVPGVFDLAFDILMGHEGGYVHHPHDPGGETNWGISKRSYPQLDIRALTREQAKAIYKRDYWDRLHLDLADPGLALTAFDAAVNNGVGAATRWLQGAIGVAADGVMGPISQEALRAAQGLRAEAALVELHAERLHMMAGLPTWHSFGRGWSRRLAQLPHQAAKLAASMGVLEVG